MGKKVKYGSMPVIQDDLFGLGSETDFSKSLKEMFSDENVEKKTELSAKQICKLNIIREMAEYYDVPLLREMYNRYIALRVSLKRKGRTEGVTMTQQLVSMKRIEAMEKQLEGGVRK